MFLYILSVLHCLQDASLKKMKKKQGTETIYRIQWVDGLGPLWQYIHIIHRGLDLSTFPQNTTSSMLGISDSPIFLRTDWIFFSSLLCSRTTTFFLRRTEPCTSATCTLHAYTHGHHRNSCTRYLFHSSWALSYILPRHNKTLSNLLNIILHYLFFSK